MRRGKTSHERTPENRGGANVRRDGGLHQHAAPVARRHDVHRATVGRARPHRLAVDRGARRHGDRALGTNPPRGDSSGTQIKELALWTAARVRPQGAPWYLESGADQTTTLQLAAERGAYALADLPTFTRLPDLGLRVLFTADTLLGNPYTLYVVRLPVPHPAARAFAAWAQGPWREALPARRLPDGSPAFDRRAGACTAGE